MNRKTNAKTNLYEWIDPLESPNQMVLILTQHIAVIRGIELPVLTGTICDGWYLWYDNHPYSWPIMISIHRSIEIHSLKTGSRWVFWLLNVHIASNSSLCGNKTTSIKWVNSGAQAIDTIWLADGRFFGWWSQHKTIKSRQ